MNVDKILADLEAKHPGEKEYLQAVREVLLTVQDEYDKHPEFEKAKIIERMVEPDRIFTFRVTWIDDRVKFKITSVIAFNSTTPLALTRGASVSTLL